MFGVMKKCKRVLEMREKYGRRQEKDAVIN